MKEFIKGIIFWSVIIGTMLFIWLLAELIISLMTIKTIKIVINTIIFITVIAIVKIIKESKEV